MNHTESLWTKIIGASYKPLFLAFVLGFAVRLIPELLLSPYPIGYDPIYYAWRIQNGVVWHHWSQVFSTWLLYAALIGVFSITRIDPFILVKFTAALLFGFNACGIYYFATKALSWTSKKGLVACVFFSLQVAAFTLSSNFYRNMLGLGVLLFALPLVKDDLKGIKRFLIVTLLSLLVVFSHELGSVILFAAVLVLLPSRLLKGANTNIWKVLIAVIPALALFLTSVYFNPFPTSFPTEKNVIWVHEPSGNYQGPLFFFKNYLAISEPVQYYSTYFNLASEVFCLFAGLYLLAVPLILAGFFREGVLDIWTALCLVGSFGVLAMPFFALDLWYRWMLMLVYPLTFYAVNGITKVLRFSRNAVNLTSRHVGRMNLWEKAVKLILIVPFSSGLIFMATAMEGNAVPLRDVDDTIKAMQWLDSRMDDDSTLLTHVVFSNWARVYLNGRYICVYFQDDIARAINVALQQDCNHVYFVWWNGQIGSYNLTVPDRFVSVFDSGRISVFVYGTS